MQLDGLQCPLSADIVAKVFFALLIKNSLGSRCDFGINMRGTSSHSDELTGDFGNKPEAILIGDHGLSCLLAEKLSLRDLRLLQQYLPIADSCSAANNMAGSVDLDQCK